MTKETLGDRIAEHDMDVACGAFATRAGTSIRFQGAGSVLTRGATLATVYFEEALNNAPCARCGAPVEGVVARVSWIDGSGRTSVVHHVGCVPWREILGRPDDTVRNPTPERHVASPNKAQRQKLAKQIITKEVPLRLEGPTGERFDAGATFQSRSDTMTEGYAAHLERVAAEKVPEYHSQARHRSLLAVWQQCHAAGAVAKMKP